MAAMEIRLDAVEGQQMPPKDTFLALRIGDVQKQSRFASSRTYRFPNPGDYRSDFGRIEVFQRVGHITVSFENVSSGQDIDVPCELGDLTSLKLRMAMDKATEKPAPSAKQTAAKSRLDAAQKYLVKYHLEEILADAMREVLHEKPNDPHAFLAEQIMKHSPKKAMQQEATEEPANVEALRMEARDALLQAAANGNLDAALGEAKGETVDVEEVRLQARDALLRSAMDGTFADALSEAKAEPTGIEALRMEARDALLKAAGDGSLDAALSEAKEGSDDVELLRMEARDALLRSAKDGSLADALSEVKAEPTGIPELRMEARDLLLRAAGDGSLDAALSEVKEGSNDVELLRMEARDALLRSAKDGSLADALSEAKAEPTSIGALRSEAANLLMQAAGNGRLEAVLSEQAKAKKAEAPSAEAKEASADVEVLRLEARDALLKSAQDGTLKTVLMQATEEDKSRRAGELQIQAKDKTADVEEILPTVLGKSHEKLIEMPKEELIVAYETELHRMDAEIERLRAKLGQ